MAIVQTTAYTEFIEFITSSPSLEAMTTFRLSDATEQRVSDLLEANRNGVISPEDHQELDEFLRLEHIMRMMKLRALEKLENP